MSSSSSSSFSSKRGQIRKRNRKQRNGNGNRNRDWSGGLPSDVVAEIMSLFTSSGDRVRFGAVCSSWRRAAKSKKPQHPPWLMLPGPEGWEDERRTLYSFSERKLYGIHLPQIQGHECIGSGDGWIATFNNLNGQLELLHLHHLNGNASTTTTPLPSITTLSDVSDVGVFDTGGRLTGYMCRTTPSHHHVSDRGHFMFDHHDLELLTGNISRPKEGCASIWYFRELNDMHHLLKKVVFFPSVSLVFLIYNHPTRLAFARLGVDEFWNEFDVDCSCIRDVAASLNYLKEGDIEDDKPRLSTYCHNFRDVVFHKGRFYSICPPGWLVALDLDSVPPRCTCLVLRPPPIICCKSLENKGFYRTTYLVESPDGEELIQVQRCIIWTSLMTNRTTSFTVFKCKLSREGGQEWVEVKCLGEWVLFLGGNLSLALSTKDFPELMPNSIYFTHNRVNKYMATQSDKGVFHLDSQIVEPVILNDDESSCPLPVWIPHGECFPLITPWQQYMVEEETTRREVSITKTIKSGHRYMNIVGRRSLPIRDCPPKFSPIFVSMLVSE